jgi:DNA-binding MarR family transcriptional regulator
LKQKCTYIEEKICLEVDLSYREIVGLGSLKKNEKSDCNTFASIMGLSVSRGSRVIDNLILKGYLSRKTADLDRRAVEITLTEKGLDCKKRIETLKKKCEKQIESNMSEAQRKIVREGLKTLDEILYVID